MEELLSLLEQFQSCLETQKGLYEELIPVLDKEEELLMKFDLGDFERVVVEKDQIVRRTANIEERRLNLLRRICFMISYDARGQLPNLQTFLMIFESYLGNIQKLVPKETYDEVRMAYETLSETALKYKALFATAQPRVRRNQTVLKKMTKNIERSLTLIQSELQCSTNYDATGKAHTRMVNEETVSSVRIKV